MKLRSKSTLRKLKPVPRNCPFCKKKIEPDYKEAEIFKNYMSDRGKILGKDRTGLCSYHQRRLTTAIKRARFLALVPFVVKVR